MRMLANERKKKAIKGYKRAVGKAVAMNRFKTKESRNSVSEKESDSEGETKKEPDSDSDASSDAAPAPAPAPRHEKGWARAEMHKAVKMNALKTGLKRGADALEHQ